MKLGNGSVPGWYLRNIVKYGANLGRMLKADMYFSR